MPSNSLRAIRRNRSRIQPDNGNPAASAAALNADFSDSSQRTSMYSALTASDFFFGLPVLLMLTLYGQKWVSSNETDIDNAHLMSVQYVHEQVGLKEAFADHPGLD